MPMLQRGAGCLIHGDSALLQLHADLEDILQGGNSPLGINRF
jgi:hypothetical protein